MTMQDVASTREVQAWFRGLPYEYFDLIGGATPAPTGWFGIFTLSEHDRVVGFSWIEPVPATVPAGCYLVRLNDRGLLWAYRGTIPEVHDAYRQLEAKYTEWEAEAIGT